MKKILKALGYGPVEPAVIKERTLYVKGSVSACLDRVEGLGALAMTQTSCPP